MVHAPCHSTASRSGMAGAITHDRRLRGILNREASAPAPAQRPRGSSAGRYAAQLLSRSGNQQMTPSTKSHVRAPGAFSVLMTLIVTLLLAACQSGPAVDIAAEESTLRQLSLDFAAAEASSNVDSALTFLWDDADHAAPQRASDSGA